MSRIPINPIKPSLGMSKNDSRAINESIRQVGELAASTGSGGVLVQRGPLGTVYEDVRTPLREDEWYGVLVNTGPNGEADFTDSRYWVCSVMLGQAARAGTYDLTQPYLDVWSYRARWGVATNIAESPLSTHSMAVIAPTANRGIPLTMNCTIVRVQTVDAGKMATQNDDFANTVGVFDVLPVSPGPRVASITSVTATVSSVEWTYKITFADSSTASAYNGVERGGAIAGSPGSLGVNVGTSGTLTGASCVVKPLGAVPDVPVTWIPSRSKWMFSLANSAS